MTGLATHYGYRDRTLCCDAVPLDRVAAEVGTPTFVYAGAGIDEAFRAVDAAVSFAPHLVAYAMKANSNLAVLARLGAAGCGADIVSGGELLRALAAGIPAHRMVFSGVGKRDDEIALAIEHGVRAIHVESAPELDAIEEAAARAGTVVPVALRVNPDVDAKTHPYIATGLSESKFGLALDVARGLLPRLLGSERLRLEGVACHIGSQLSTPAPLREAVAITARFARECREAGAPVRSLDAGGGWPLRYGDEREAFPPYDAYGQAVRAGIEEAGAAGLDLELIVEPGRALVGAAGVLLTRVIFVKEQGGKRFVVVDGSMSELIRPALYQAHHEIVPVVEPAPAAARRPADVVGPVCETGDFLALGRPMPPVGRGDLLAVCSAGAYGITMSSNYNTRPLPAEVMVDGDGLRVVRPRQALAAIWAGEAP